MVKFAGLLALGVAFGGSGGCDSRTPAEREGYLRNVYGPKALEDVRAQLTRELGHEPDSYELNQYLSRAYAPGASKRDYYAEQHRMDEWAASMRRYAEENRKSGPSGYYQGGYN
jgi:hypothetical protein